jgi:hypothetical protein
MQADPWWSFAMAVNVYLVFFYNVNPSSFRKHAWIYCLVCYGGPMVTAIALFAVRNDPRGLIYGDAVVSSCESPRMPLKAITNVPEALVLD